MVGRRFAGPILRTGRHTLEINELPVPFRRLSAGEVEDCVCIYKKELKQIHDTQQWAMCPPACGATMAEEKGKFVDFAQEMDLEEFRDYFDSAINLGVLEKYRSRIERTNDLESLRPLLEKLAPVLLPGYPGT